MAEIATAYVQIEPTAKGISGKISSMMGDEGAKGGASFTKGFGSVMGGIGKVALGAVTAAGAAVAGVTKEAVSAFADYEQLSGGIETLFDNSEGARMYGEVLKDMGYSMEEVAKATQEAANLPIDTVMNNASNAYQTAGMSANDYMETVIGMAAALNNSTGDLQVSADMADMAITDMADNVNKMGTSMEGVQNAYRGFSRGNYTMLDNLALGFAGTKDGMQELLDSAQEISGVEYDISSYADIVEAIHVVQTEMGITGTTAKEGATTISGSLNQTKAAWQNLITGIGAGDNLQPLIQNLISSIETFAGNLMPVIETALNGISSLIANLAPVIAEKLPGLVDSLLPPLLSAATTLIVGLVNALPNVITVLVEALPGIITQIVDALIVALPVLIAGIIQLVTALVEHLPEIMVAIIQAIPQIITSVVDAIITNAPMLINALIQIGQMMLQWIIQHGAVLLSNIQTIMTNLINNMKAWLSQLPTQVAYFVGQMIAKFVNLLIALPGKAQQVWSQFMSNLKAFGQRMISEGPQIATQFGEKLMNGLKQIPSKIAEIGKDIVEGLKNGIKNAWNGMTDWIKELADSLIKGFKDNLKIGSPSKVFRDEIGRWIPAGIAEGIEDGMGVLDTAMTDMTMSVMPTSMEDISTASYNASTTQSGTDNQVYNLLAQYLPIIASGENVNVTLDVDGQRLFRIIQQQQARNTQLVGVNA